MEYLRSWFPWSGRAEDEAAELPTKLPLASTSNFSVMFNRTARYATGPSGPRTAELASGAGREFPSDYNNYLSVIGQKTTSASHSASLSWLHFRTSRYYPQSHGQKNHRSNEEGAEEFHRPC